jgi:hypothetical protein
MFSFFGQKKPFIYNSFAASLPASQETSLLGRVSLLDTRVRVSCQDLVPGTGLGKNLFRLRPIRKSVSTSLTPDKSTDLKRFRQPGGASLP